MSYKELPVLGEESYLDFSFPKIPVCIPAGFPGPFAGLIHKLTDALLMLFISDTWWVAFYEASENAPRLLTFQQVHFESFAVKS